MKNRKHFPFYFIALLLFNLVPLYAQTQSVCGFTFSEANPCPGDTVTLAVTNPQAGHWYTWKFSPAGVSPITGDTVDVVFPVKTNTQIYQAIVFDTLNGMELCSDTLSIPVKPAPDIDMDLAPGSTPGTQISGNIISLCGNAAPIKIRFKNISSMAASTALYTISWGDSTVLENYTPNDFPVTHTYMALGKYKITITATHFNGCTSTRTYFFFSGTNPPLSVTSPGGTVGLCAPDTVNFMLGGYQDASPATTYQILVNGKPYDSFTQDNIKDTLPVIFKESSCGQGSGPNANIFVVTIRGGVPGCPQTEIDVKPVTVSSAPVAAMQVTKPLHECPDEVWKFTNRSWGAAVIKPGINNTYVCDSTNSVEWLIFGGTQGIDWAYVSGGQNDPMIQVTFKKTGTFLVRMKAYNSNFSCPSGVDSTETIIVVAEKPTADADVVASVNSCIPVTLAMRNFSLNGTTPKWSVEPQGSTPANGYQFDLPNGNMLWEPTITLTRAGTYRIRLESSNPCGMAVWDTIVIVQATPVVNLQPLSTCEDKVLDIQSVKIAFNANGSPVTDWLWVFAGNAVPATSIDSMPQGIIFPDSGTYVVVVNATNNCGTGADTSFVQVTAKPYVDVATVFDGGPECLPASVIFQQTAQTGVTYLRTITLPPNGNAQYVQGDSSTPAANIKFVGRGTYKIHFEARNHCDTSYWDWEHIFYETPGITLPSVGPFCDSATIDFSPSMIALDISNGGDPNATYEWLFPNGSPDNSDQQFPGKVFFKNTSGSTQAITVYLTVSNVCTTVPVVSDMTFQLQVPADIVLDPVSPNVCQNGNEILLSSSPPGIWFGPGVSGNIFNPATPGLSLGTPLALTCTVGTGVCTSEATDTIVVLPVPSVEAGPNQGICIENDTMILPDVTGGTWSISPPGVLTAGGKSIDLQSSKQGDFTVALTVTALNGCVASDSFLLQIKNNYDPNPPDTTYCGVSGLVHLPLFNLPGLVYSGQYVMQPGNWFDPEGLENKQITVSYSMTNAADCIFEGNILVDIVAPLSPGAVQAGPDRTLCKYSDKLPLSGSPSPGYWSVSPVTPALQINSLGAPCFDPALADTGIYYLVFTVGGGNCADYQKDTMILRVVDLIVDAGLPEKACHNDLPIYLKPGSVPLAPGIVATWSGEGIEDSLTGLFSPIKAGLYDHIITLKWGDSASGCIFSDEKVVTVHGLAGSFFEVPGLKCEGDTLTLQNKTPGQAFWKWFADGAPTLFSTLHSPELPFSKGSHTVLLVGETNQGCRDSFPLTFDVEALPTAMLTAITPVVGCNPLTVSFQYQANDTAAAWFIIDNSIAQKTMPVQPSLVFENSGSDAVKYLAILVAENVCATVYDTVEVTVKSDPVADFVPTYDHPCSGQIIECNVTSTGNPTASYFFTSENPAMPILADPLLPTTFQFLTNNQPRTVVISLVSWNECKYDTFSRTITVMPADVSALFNIKADTSRLCPGASVQVTNGSTPGPPAKWETSWGDKFVGDTVNIELPGKPGVYEIKIIIEGCGFDEFSMPIQVLQNPEVTLQVSPYSCLGEAANFFVTTTGDSFTLYFGDGDSTNLNISSHLFAQSGNYQPMVAVTSLEGCIATAGAQVSVLSPPSYSILLHDTCTIAAGTDVTIQTGPFNKVELTGNGHSQVGEFHSGLIPGWYNLVVQTPEGCTADTLFAIPEPKELRLKVDTNLILIELGKTATLAARVNLQNVTFHWSPGSYVYDSTAAVTEAFPVSDTRFTVIATTSRGCTASGEVFVNVQKELAVYFPNIFAPESDGANEKWYISASIGISKIKLLQIFDRWGNEVYMDKDFPPNDASKGWDGLRKGTQKRVLPGVYVFAAVLERTDGQNERKSGSITIIR